MDEDRLDVGDYVALVRRRIWWIVAITAGVVAVGVAVSVWQQPEYTASTDVAIEPFRAGEDSALEEVILGDVTVNTEQEVLTSRLVTDRVIDDLGLTRAPDDLIAQVDVRVKGSTRVLEVRVVDPDPTMAAAIADAYANAYLDQRREDAVAALDATQTALDQRIEALGERLAAVDAEIAALAPTGPEADPATGDAVADPDRATRDARESERDAILQELNRLALQAAQAEADTLAVGRGGRVLNPAQVPTSPTSPQPVRNILAALLLGGLLGLGVALLRDHLDDVVRDEDGARRVDGRLPILGRVPWWGSQDRRVAVLVHPDSARAEAYRVLSASVRFLSVRPTSDPATTGSVGGAQVLLVTSPDAGDGKSATAVNLAVAAAGTGRRVVLVGSDLRRPTLHESLGLPVGAGLSDVLVDRVRLEDALVDVGVPGLEFLGAGSLPPNPSELLASRPMHVLLDELRARADLVVLDAPPVLAVADSLELGAMADRTILVIRAGSTRGRHLQECLVRLDAVGVDVAGLVLNGVVESSTYDRYGADVERVAVPVALGDESVSRTGPSDPAAPAAAVGRRRPGSDDHDPDLFSVGHDDA